MKKLTWILTPLLIILLISSQVLADSSSRDFRTETKKASLSLSEPIIPSVTALKIMSLGNPSLAADVLWLQTIQYFGSGNPYGDYPSLGPLLNTITKLDPKFEGAYEFGLVVLPFMKQSDMAITLGQRAQTALPNNGLLTYYLATVYHLNKKDYRNAAKYYQKAALLPDSPTAAKQLAGVSLAELSDSLSDRLVAMEFWKTVYENTTDPDKKERAALWFAHMQIVYELEKDAETYHAQTGHFPNNQQDLIKAGLLKDMLVSPINRELQFDSETGKINFDRLAS